jgi:histidinol-phosphatase
VPADDVAALLSFAHGMLDETDAIALHHFGGELTIDAKPDRSLVTQADTGIETRLRDRIADAFPRHTVAGEEFGVAGDGGDGRWIVDPIDATHNFMRRIQVFATLLACRVDDELLLGLASAPAMGERWWATQTGGAWRRRHGRDQRIGVSSVASLADGQMLFGRAQALNGRVAAASRHTWRDRGFGDFWGHMLVASGSAEAMVEDGVSLWDMAAPYVIVTAAGGRMTNLGGQPSWTDPQLLTSNGLVHDELLGLLQQ